MKYILLMILSTNLYAQQHRDSHQQKMNSIVQEKDTISIAILLYDNVVLQDFSGPMEVFDKAQNLTKGKYKTFTIGLKSKEIHTENSLLKITTDYTLRDFTKADYIIIPGASMPVIKELMTDKILTKFIQRENTKVKTKIVSVCTASYLLANAGILDGKKATTHYFVAEDFREQYPNVQLVQNVRYVDQGKIITSSGVTSGIDAALYIVGQHSGEMIQGMINRALQYTYGQNEIWPIAPQGMRYRSEK
ncbi:DJ-1/PfpI family protein [Chishuiella sp.]|uniref:DJ-1/PfpI family protein n=1 Tax=Chishuiella sp. TaxID=1969467 RepID=UPI0028A7D884|nr:DJ-1/PfpI family protein [Chishuiella sp.]